MRALKKRCAELEATATLAQGEASGLARQMEGLGKEVQALRAGHSRVEGDLRQQVREGTDMAHGCKRGGRGEGVSWQMSIRC